jgi:hypothetical protein
VKAGDRDVKDVKTREMLGKEQKQMNIARMWAICNRQGIWASHKFEEPGSEILTKVR